MQKGAIYTKVYRKHQRSSIYRRSLQTYLKIDVTVELQEFNSKCVLASSNS